MKYGARNQIAGTVKKIKKGALMGQVNLTIKVPAEMASVMTLDSIKDMKLKTGDKVKVIVKAINVLLVKE